MSLIKVLTNGLSKLKWPLVWLLRSDFNLIDIFSEERTLLFLNWTEICNERWNSQSRVEFTRKKNQIRASKKRILCWVIWSGTVPGDIIIHLLPNQEGCVVRRDRKAELCHIREIIGSGSREIYDGPYTVDRSDTIANKLIY